MDVKLVFPKEQHMDLWKDIVNGIEAAGEEMVPYALSYRQEDYQIFFQKTIEYHNGINLKGWVPGSTYFLMDDKESRIFGAVNIRHALTQDLLNKGGHVGYGIRPSERRKGYATLILGLALEKCRELGIKETLITCDKNNTGSARTIQKNGGVLENEIIEEGENAVDIVQRYWIQL